MSKVAMAAGAHPDDVDLMMAGTLILLKAAGYEIHYLNIANGSCGTADREKDDIIRIRTDEARRAAASIGAVFHPPLVDDLEIFYDNSLISRLCAIVREVAPDILLLPSPEDYMEDHMNAGRTMVTAAFCRNMRNYVTDPPSKPIDNEMCLYRALPWGLTDQQRRPIRPHFCVDIQSVLAKKRAMLACHVSQKVWLDESQGHDNYLNTMEDMARQVGSLTGVYQYAEGWRQHLHLGFGPEEFDPLGDALPALIHRLDPA